MSSHKNKLKTQCSREVALLSSLPTDLAQSQTRKEANVPQKHVKPEIGVDRWPSREVCQLLSDGGEEGSRQTAAAEGRDRSGGRNTPTNEAKDENQRIRV